MLIQLILACILCLFKIAIDNVTMMPSISRSLQALKRQHRLFDYELVIIKFEAHTSKYRIQPSQRVGHLTGIIHMSFQDSKPSWILGEWVNSISACALVHSVSEIITVHISHIQRNTKGKFDRAVWYVIIFLCVQFWIRLAAVSNRSKKVRTVASPAVRSMNKSRDTWNFAQNKPEYAVCVIFTTRSYYKTLGLILCYQIWQIRHNVNRLDDGHCDITCHRTASAMVTTHENSVMMWSFKGPKLFCVL